MSIPQSGALHVICCEDIRIEAGGRRSYMGVYTNQIPVPSFPNIIRICFAVTFVPSQDVVTEVMQVTQHTLRVRIGDTTIALLPLVFQATEANPSTTPAQLNGFTFEINIPVLHVVEASSIFVGVSIDGVTFTERELPIGLSTPQNN